MLATLNLQLSPVELPDDTLRASGPLLPDAGGEAESGFADLLRLRVDASLPSNPAVGELLPQDGSNLPIQVDRVTTDHVAESVRISGLVPEPLSPEMTKPVLQLTEEGDTTALAGRPDVVLDDAVIYPPVLDDALIAPALADDAPISPALTDASAGASEIPAIAAPLATPTPVRFDAAATGATANDATARLAVTSALPEQSQVTRPEVAARIQDVLSTVGERPVISPASTGLPDRGQLGPPQSGSPLSNQVVEGNERLPLIDLPKRPDVMPLARAEGLGEAFTEPARPQGTVPNPVQALHAQLNTQAPQTIATASSGPTVSGESTYATAAQQATDLIGTSVRDSAWGERIGERVLLMTGNQLRTADIRLTPAELGPLRVQVSVDDGAANVTFQAQHAVTREALEQALPRLREMLAENGLSLGQADISEQGVAQGEKDGETDVPTSTAAAEESHDAGVDDDHRAASGAVISDSLVDTFA